jgi:hypothetical protein
VDPGASLRMLRDGLRVLNYGFASSDRWCESVGKRYDDTSAKKFWNRSDACHDLRGVGGSARSCTRLPMGRQHLEGEPALGMGVRCDGWPDVARDLARYVGFDVRVPPRDDPEKGP